MNPVFVTAEFHAKPDKSHKVLELLKSVIEPSRKEPGCLFYELYQAEDQEDTFFIFERWKSHDDVRQHLTSSHVTETAKVLQEYLQDSFIVRYFTQIPE